MGKTIKKEMKIESSADVSQIKLIMIKEATGTDLIAVNTGQKKISNTGNFPAKIAKSTPSTSASPNPPTILIKLNQTEDKKSGSCQITASLASTERGEASKIF